MPAQNPNQPYLDPNMYKLITAGAEDEPMLDEYARQQELANQLRGQTDLSGTTQAGRVTVANPFTPLNAAVRGYAANELGDQALEGRKGVATAAAGRRSDYLRALEGGGNSKDDLMKQATGQAYGNQG